MILILTVICTVVIILSLIYFSLCICKKNKGLQEELKGYVVCLCVAFGTTSTTMIIITLLCEWLIV